MLHSELSETPKINFLQFFCLFWSILIKFESLLHGFLWGKLNFQAVIKSAASAASPTAWGAPDDGARWDDGVGRTTERIRTTARGAPQAVGEAALAADLITAWV